MQSHAGIASNEVIVHLIKTKCLPVLYYGYNPILRSKSQFSIFNFVKIALLGMFLILGHKSK